MNEIYRKNFAVLLLVLIPALAVAAQIPNDSLPMLKLERIFPSLTFERPVFLTHSGDDSKLLYVVEQDGVIHRIDPASPKQAEVFLDIRSRVSRGGNEEGLLGLAFSPTFPDNGRFYVYYSAAKPRRSVLSRFKTGADGLGDAQSEEVLLEVKQPFPNHNGGMITFGPDGMLYIGLGDGGSAGDPFGNGQNPGTLLGTILRIDTDQPADGAPYAIPADNPFVGESGARGEVWAFGLRNPWRFSFDTATGDLWVGDVGQNAREEVDIVYPGVNYGWNVMEGSQCFRAASCDDGKLQPPVAEYDHSLGCSITGGYVYRGQRVRELEGAYLYADFCSGRIWGLRHDGAAVTAQGELVKASFQISSFGEDTDGEVYVVGFDGGIYRLAAAPGEEPPKAATALAPSPTSPSTVRPQPTPTSDPAVIVAPTPTGAPTLELGPTPTVTLPAPESSTSNTGWRLIVIVVAVVGTASGLAYLVLRSRSVSKRG